MNLFGATVWLGWLMIAVMAVTAVPPVIVGRLKLGLARELHDKVLYADADMNKADWMTSLGTIVGSSASEWFVVDGCAAAVFIAGSIVHDGVSNLRAAVVDLMDAGDDLRRHATASARRTGGSVSRWPPWVREAGSRVRDEGHVFHIEAFVVPRRRKVAIADIEHAREACVGSTGRSRTS